MTDSEKLIELLKKADENVSAKLITDYEDSVADIADYLLANGVVVSPGDLQKASTISKALDLINRLQAEIKDLQKVVIDDYASEYDNKIKAEAYKEFADLSIRRICEEVSAPTPSESYIVEKCNQTIDELLKEKVGE
jgi:DNA-binding ferritin-like protein (Dps family)